MITRRVYYLVPLVALILLMGILTLHKDAALPSTVVVVAHRYQQAVADTINQCGQTYECAPGTFKSFAAKVEQIPFPRRLRAAVAAVRVSALQADKDAEALTNCQSCIVTTRSLRYHMAVARLVRADALLRHELHLPPPGPPGT